MYLLHSTLYRLEQADSLGDARIIDGGERCGSALLMHVEFSWYWQVPRQIPSITYEYPLPIEDQKPPHAHTPLTAGAVPAPESVTTRNVM